RRARRPTGGRPSATPYPDFGRPRQSTALREVIPWPGDIGCIAVPEKGWRLRWVGRGGWEGLAKARPPTVGLPSDGLRWHPSLLLGLLLSAPHERFGLTLEEGNLLLIPEG